MNTAILYVITFIKFHSNKSISNHINIVKLYRELTIVHRKLKKNWFTLYSAHCSVNRKNLALNSGDRTHNQSSLQSHTCAAATGLNPL